MGLEHLANDGAKLVVVLERFDLLDLAKGMERLIIQVVNVVDVRIRSDAVRELLHVSYPVRDPGVESACQRMERSQRRGAARTLRRYTPGWQLRAYIVGRV